MQHIGGGAPIHKAHDTLVNWHYSTTGNELASVIRGRRGSATGGALRDGATAERIRERAEAATDAKPEAAPVAVPLLVAGADLRWILTQQSVSLCSSLRTEAK